MVYDEYLIEYDILTISFLYFNMQHSLNYLKSLESNNIYCNKKKVSKILGLNFVRKARVSSAKKNLIGDPRIKEAKRLNEV